MKKTFRSIAESKGIKWQPEPNPSSLTLWSLSIEDVPIDELEMEDLCRAVRQDLFTSELLPIAVAELDKDVLVGFMDDAELLMVVSRLSETYWVENRSLLNRMLDILHRDKELIAEEPRAINYAKSLQDKLNHALASGG